MRFHLPELNRDFVSRCLPGAVLLGLIAGVVLFRSPNFVDAQRPLDEPLGGDFLQDWVGGRMVSDGDAELLYDGVTSKSIQHDIKSVGFAWEGKGYFPMVYPPTWYALMKPLAKFSYPAAMRLWLGVSLLAFPVLVGLLLLLGNAERKHMAVAGVALALFPPVISGMVMGQKSLLFATLLAGVVILCLQGRERSAGWLLGPMLCKPTLLPFVVLVMLVRRRWGFVVSAGCSIVGIVLLTSLVTGVNSWFSYAEVVSGAGRYHLSGGYDHSLAQNLGGLVNRIAGGQPIIYWPSFLILSGLVLLPAVKLLASSQDEGAGEVKAWIVAIVATVLLNPHFFFYDLTLVLIALALLYRVRSRSVATAWSFAFFLATAVHAGVWQACGIAPAPLVLIGMLNHLAFGVHEGAFGASRVVRCELEA